MPNSFPFYDAQPYWPEGGYGNGGGGNGGSGGGTASLIDFQLWNNTEADPTRVPTSVSYVSGISNDTQVLTDLRFDVITQVVGSTTISGIHVYDCPVGAALNLGDCVCAICYLPDGKSDLINDAVESRGNVCLMPIDGCTISGFYARVVGDPT